MQFDILDCIFCGENDAAYPVLGGGLGLAPIVRYRNAI